MMMRAGCRPAATQEQASHLDQQPFKVALVIQINRQIIRYEASTWLIRSPLPACWPQYMRKTQTHAHATLIGCQKLSHDIMASNCYTTQIISSNHP